MKTPPRERQTIIQIMYLKVDFKLSIEQSKIKKIYGTGFGKVHCTFAALVES